MLLALAGPIVWLAHFFALYLAEAFLVHCPWSRQHDDVRTMAVVLTVLATLVLSVAASGSPPASAVSTVRTASGTHLAFARPLALLSILAVLWTFVPAVPAAGLHAGGG